MRQASDAASAICPGRTAGGVTGHARPRARERRSHIIFLFSSKSRTACLPHEGDVSSEAGMGVCAKNGSDACAFDAGREAGRCLSNSIERLAERAARGRFRLQLCSVIVHLHLNRHPLAPGLPHPEQPVCAGGVMPRRFRCRARTPRRSWRSRQRAACRPRRT